MDLREHTNYMFTFLYLHPPFQNSLPNLYFKPCAEFIPFFPKNAMLGYS